MNDNKKEYLIDVDGRKGRVKSEDFENNLDQFIEELPQARIAVTSPDGTKGSVPLSNYKNAISKGYAAIFAQEPTQEKSQALPSEPQALTRHLDMTNNEVVKQTMDENSSKKIGELGASLPQVPVIPGQSPLDYTEKVAAITDRIQQQEMEKQQQAAKEAALPQTLQEIDDKIRQIDERLRENYQEQLPPMHSPEGVAYPEINKLFNPKKTNYTPEQIKEKTALEQQRQALTLQRKFLDSIKEYQAYDQKGDQSRINRFLGGLAVKGDLQDFATLGISEIERDLEFAGILGKAERGEKLTLDESKAIQLYQNLKEIESLDRGAFFNAGAGAQQSFELMRDMLLGGMGGGISTIGRLGIKQAIKSASKQFAKKSLETMYKTALMPSFYRNIAKGNVENYSIKNVGTEDKPVWDVDMKNPMSKMLYRQWAQQYSEVLTENLGSAFESIGLLTRIAKKANKAGGIIGKGARLYDKIHNKAIHNNVSKYIVDGLDKMGLQSFPMEFVEEIANVPLQSMLLGENQLPQLIDPRFYQEVAISTAALSGVGGAVNVAAGGASALIERRKSDKAIENYTQSIQDAIDNIDDVSHKAALSDLLSDLDKANYYDANGEFDGSQLIEDLSRVKYFEGDSQTYKDVESLVKEKLYREGQTQALKAIMEDEVGEIEYGTSGDVVAALDKDGAFLFILGETDDTYLVSNPQTKEQKVISKGDIERYGETKSVDRAVTDYFVTKATPAVTIPMTDISQVQQTQQAAQNETAQAQAPLQKGDKATYEGVTVTVDDVYTDDEGNTIAIITDDNNNSHNVSLESLKKLEPIINKDRYILPDGRRAVIAGSDGDNITLDIIDDNNNIIDKIVAKADEISTFDKVPAEQANTIEGITSEQQAPPQEAQEVQQQDEVQQQPQQAELPVDKDGNTDYDALLESDPERFIQEYSKVVGPQVVLEQLSEVVQEIDKQIQSKNKEVKKTTSFNKKASLSAEVSQLQKRRDSLTSQILKLTQPQQEQQKQVQASTQENIISQKWNNATKVQGNSDTRTLSDGSQLKGHWVLAEADAPTPSHDPHTLSPSEGFPTTSEGKNINDNDYTKKSAEVRIMAADYDGRAIDNPIFVKDGVVISGNNRTMSGLLAAENGTDSKYLQALQQRAQSLGFTAEQIASMKHPRVFFEVEDDVPMTTEMFAKFNQRETKSKTPTERAIVASKRDNSRLVGLILSEIDKHEKLSDVYQDTNSSAAIVKYMTQTGLINSNEVPELFENGSFTANGKDFLESLLIGSTIKEEQIKVLNTEGMKNLRSKVVKSIIPLVENSKLRKENQIIEDINQAILYLYQAKAAKMTLGELIRQNDMFERKLFDEDAVFVALKLQQSEKDFRNFVEQVNARLSTDTANMFTGELETKQDIYGEFEQQLSDSERAVIEGARENNKLSQESTLPLYGSGPITRRSEPDGVLKEPESEDQIKPIGVGVFGNIYNQFKGQAKAAIAFLKKRKEGEAIGALSHPEVGDISLVWGNPKAGLEKILSKHSEVLNVLQEVIHDMKVVQKSDNRIKLESPTHFAVVSKEWMGKPREQWLLTAYEKKQMSASGGSMDINPEPFGKQNDTAPLQNAHLSESKVSKPASDIQQKSSQTVLEKAQNNAINNEIDSQAQQTNTSPSQAQKEAGNYKMGHVKVQGLNISIENPAGSTRSGVDANGQKWSVTMNNHYGYIRGTKGKDKDHIDVFLGKNQLSDKVYVIDQINNDGSFDEHKVMIGFDSAQQARQAYLSNYSEGWNGLGNITEVSMREFKSWIDNGTRKVKPFAEYRAHSLENIKQQAADYSRKYGTTVEVIESAEDIENPIARMAAQQYGIFGWYDINSKKVFVYAPNMINRPSELEKTILHEVVAHKGLRELLGDIAFNKLCDDVWEMMSEADKRKWAAYAMRVSEDDVDLNEVNAGLKVKREAADEFMASFAEDGIKNQSIWQRIKEAVLNALRAMGIDIQLTDADIAYMLYRSSKALEKNATIKEKADAKIKTEQIEMNLSDEAAAKEKGFEEPLRLRFIGTKGASILDQQVDKKKVSDWLNTADLDSPIRIDNPKLLSVTKLINDFENPTISSENSSEVRFKVTPKSDIRFRYKTSSGKNVNFTQLSLFDQNEETSQDETLLGRKLRPLQQGEFCHVERVFAKSKAFDFTSAEKIESSDDVAYIFSQLEDESVENSFAVLVKDGKPYVLHLGMGDFSQTVFNIAAIKAADNLIKADDIYMVHNHPSGNLRASSNDMNMLSRMRQAFGNRLKDGIIINLKTGKYGTFTELGLDDQRQKATPKESYPVEVYSFSKQVFDYDYDPANLMQINSSIDAASFISGHRLGDRAKISLLILNRQSKVVGNILTPFSMNALDEKKKLQLAEQIVDYVIKMGGEVAIAYGSGIDVNNAKQRKDIGEISRRVQSFSGYTVSIVDWIYVEGNAQKYVSAAEEGIRLRRVTEQEYDSYQQRLDEVDSQITDIDNIPQEVIEQREEIFNEYLSNITNEPYSIISRHNYKEVMQENGVDGQIIQAVEAVYSNPENVSPGMYTDGRIYFFADKISSIENLRLTLIHERQHRITDENWEKYSNDVINRVENIEELRDVVEKLSGGDYSDADWGELVSEFYSFAMMYVYTGKNYPQRFKSLGINNELIDLIKQLDYEQQQNNDYIDSRRGTARNEALHGTNLGSDSQDVRDSLQGTTQMGEQRQRPAQGGQRGTQDPEGDISSTNQQADESERNNNNANSRGRQIQILNSEYEQLGVNSQDVRYPRQGSSELGEQRGRFEVPGQEGTQGTAGSIDKGNQVRLRYTPIFQSNAERALLDIKQELFRRALDGDVITADKIAAKGLKATLGDDSYNRMIGEIFDILPLMDKAAYSKRGLSKESVVASMVDRIANDIPGNMDDLLMVLSIVKDSLNEKSLAILPDNTDLLLQLWKETSLPEAVTIKEKLSNLAKVNQIRLRAEKDMPPATNDVKLTRRQVWEERLQDRMISVKIFYDELAKIGVKPSMDMNSYVTENLALSRSQSEDYQFKQDIYRPLIQEVTQVESLFKELGLAKDNEQAYKLVNDYLYARHAKERNKQICCEEIVEKMMYKIFKNERTLFKDNIRNALMNLASRMYNERKPNHTAPVTSSTFAKNLLKTKGDTAQEQKLLESFRKRFVEIVDQAQEDMDKIFSSKNGTNRSGMTDAQSEEILKNLYTDSTKKQLEKLSDMVRKSTHFTIDTWEKYSLIDKQTAENMKKMYEYYIPLRGWEVTEDVDYSQLPNQAFNKASQIITANKKAQGRTSKADDPLTYIASLAQTAIVTGNKNMIRLNLYRLIKANQGNKALEAYATLPKLFYVEMPGSETAIVTDERPSQELFDQGLVKTKSNKAYHWHKSHAEYDAHIVPVMVNGTRQMIELRGELGIKVAAAINNTNVLHWQAAEALKPVTNWLSSIRTSYNPEFILLNFIRDFMFANMAYGIEGGDRKELDKNLLKAFRSIHYLQSGKPVDSKWDVYYTEFLENGGQTGFFTMQNIDAMKRELATMHSKMLRGKQIVSRGKKIAEYCNAMSESAMRLAVFITEREKGTSAKEAAYKAHEISVNFNRKGTWSGVFGGFYSFFNASVQGTARLFQVLESNKKKAAATVGTIALAKLASAVIAAAVGGDDYKELSDYVKFSNIVIPIGKDEKGKTVFFLIPMAQGLRAITNIADNIVEAMIGNKSVFEAGKTTLLNVIGEFLPLSFDAIDLTGKQTLYSYATVVAPTVIQPMLDVWVNQDFKGDPIYKRPYLASQEGFIPEYKNVYGNVSPWFVGGSKIFNRLGGGDDLRSASVWVDKQGNVKESPFGYYFDVNPAKVEHLLNGYLGGFFSFPTNFIKTIHGALDDQPGVNLYNIPLAGRFVRKSYQMDGYADYFAIRDYVQTIKMSISAAKKAGDIQSAMTIQKRNAKLLNAYKVYEDRVKQLKEHLNNDEISAQKRDELNRKMDELILQAAQDLNQINNETDSRD